MMLWSWASYLLYYIFDFQNPNYKSGTVSRQKFELSRVSCWKIRLFITYGTATLSKNQRIQRANAPLNHVDLVVIADDVDSAAGDVKFPVVEIDDVIDAM